MTRPADPASLPPDDEVVEGAEPAAPAPAGRGSGPYGAGGLDLVAERVVDRLNPILVREVRQAVNGKGFVLTALLALLGTVLIGLFAAAGGSSIGRGAEVFLTSLSVLAPIVLFIVPLQAFLSTRQEVTRGTVEHLLLSRLTPGQIVRGKLAAATVQFVLYVAIFAPLVAMTFLLRGVDVPTIVWALLLALGGALAASSLAVACGALSRWPTVFRAFPLLLLVLGLGFLLVGAELFIWEGLFEFSRVLLGEEWWLAMTSLLLPAFLAIVLCGLIGSAALSHPYENRSTGFRLFGFALVLGLFAWFAFVVWPNLRFVSSRSSDGIWGVSVTLGGLLALFAIFASTEAPRLTPRVATRVPKNPLLRLVSVPFLPGCGRGLLYTLLLAVICMAVPLLFEASGWTRYSEDAAGVAALLWAYVVFYSGVAAFVRVRMGQAQKYNWIARAVPLGLLLAAYLLPLLAEVILGTRSIGDWEFYRILDPITTIGHHSGRGRHPADILGIVLVLTAIPIALNVVPMWDGVSEVVSARRRPKRRR